MKSDLNKLNEIETDFLNFFFTIVCRFMLTGKVLYK